MSANSNRPEVVASAANDFEAAPLLAALAERGIETTTTGSFTADFRAEAPGRVQILVRQEYLAQAKEALQAIEDGDYEIDWSQVDVGEPE